MKINLIASLCTISFVLSVSRIWNSLFDSSIWILNNNNIKRNEILLLQPTTKTSSSKRDQFQFFSSSLQQSTKISSKERGDESKYGTKKEEEKKVVTVVDDDKSFDDEAKARREKFIHNKKAWRKVTFFDDDSSTDINCWILMEHVKFLSCGADGHAFKTTMDCTAATSSNTTTTINTADTAISSSNIRNVVLKVATTLPPYEDKNISASSYKCISETESNLQKFKHVYQKLLLPTLPHTSSSSSNTVREKIRDERFHPPIGSVHVPVNQLYSSVVNLNEIRVNKAKLVLCGELVHVRQQKQKQHNNDDVAYATKEEEEEEEEDLIVVGTITEVAKGKSLNPKRIKKSENDDDDGMNHRRRIVNNLTCMWQYMYKQDFIHQDMSFTHIFDDGNITSLIDFQRYDILTSKRLFYESSDDDNKEKKHNKKIRQLQIIQLYQLMTLIGNICMGKHTYVDVPYYVVRDPFERLWMKDENIPKLQSAFTKCNFDGDDDNEHHHDDQQTLIPTSAILDLPSSLFDYYQKVKGNKNTTTTVAISSQRRNSTTTNATTIITNDGDDDIVGSIYQLLSQWSGGECLD